MEDLTTWTPSQINAKIAELGKKKRVVEAAYDRYFSFDPTTHQFVKRPGTEIEVAVALATLDAVRNEMMPYLHEYQRRGRWTRCYVVPGGHFHSTVSCPTCNHLGKPTDFNWRTDLSGQPESRIVELAGDRACTVCYPSAV